MTAPLSDWIRHWALIPDGPVMQTHAAWLMPVLWQGQAAMLKCATTQEERQGAEVLRWFGPDVAAEVFALDGPAVVMARGGADLAGLAAADDTQATKVICAMAERLHRPRAVPPGLVKLSIWFRGLTGAAGRARFAAEAALAEALLDSTPDPAPLHGDLHHGNILRFDQDWRVIDPKGLWGDRCFEFVQMFYNPDALGMGHALATKPGVFRARLAQVSRAADLDPGRLCGWIEAHAALSQCWAGRDDDTRLAKAIGALAHQMR